MTKLSYRDVLNATFEDKELVEFLVEFLDAYKNFGAHRLPKYLPAHTLVTLIDRVKALQEQQIDFYKKGAQDHTYDLAVITDETGAANDDIAAA